MDIRPVAEPSAPVHPRYDDQVQRERAQRDIALGRRVQSLTEGQGHTGTVVKRWVNASVVPIAARLRAVAGAFLDGDTHEITQLLDSPLFGLAEFEGDGHQDLGPVMRWLLKGGSPGRVKRGDTHTYAEDLVLAAMGVVLERLVKASRGDTPCTMALVLHLAADALRETAIGQFLTTVQGADAMQAVRQRGPKGSWQQRNKLDQVAALMGGQVRGTLEAEARGEVDLEKVGGRRVLRVTEVDTRDGTLRQRRISLRPPQAGDFDLLRLASRPKGERDPHRQTWNSLAMMVLCAAQAEGGWFDIVGIKPKHSHGKTRRPTKGLVLSEAAERAVEGDLQRWLESAGMMLEPMVCPPAEGDYLTVQRRAVTGRTGPMGLRTQAEGTRSWRAAVDVLAGTAWSVQAQLLAAIREDPRVEALAARSEPDEGRRVTILAGYRKVAAEPEFWLPIQLDFRGRMYPKTTWVTYQGTDLQKGLMCWPAAEYQYGDAWSRSIILHTAALYGHGLDKAPFGERAQWFSREVMSGNDPVALAEGAEEPLALLAALMLYHAGQGDRIAIQIDGTCNGLQHLSALFRDERAATWVNLGATTLEDKPSDLYLAVAARVSAALGNVGEDGWRLRLSQAGIEITRKLAKKPVMVLPYGGTRVTIHEAVAGSVLDQLGGDAAAVPAGVPQVGGSPCPWRTHPDYAAFEARALEEHPLFRADARALGDLVYDAIGEVIPKAMLAMEAFRAIAKKVGERALEWRVGPHEDDLWVVHAYAVSAMTRTTLKGFHLPNSVRSLAMRVGRDEIDKGKHASGIVANFIHSLDSAHLARTAARFKDLGGTSFGAIHDCLLSRPSEAHLQGRAVRETFKEMYEEDPLSWPVRIREPKSGELEEYPSWYALAAAFGVELPERGTWEPAEVMDSAWFFS